MANRAKNAKGAGTTALVPAEEHSVTLPKGTAEIINRAGRIFEKAYAEYQGFRRKITSLALELLPHYDEFLAIAGRGGRLTWLAAMATRLQDAPPFDPSRSKVPGSFELSLSNAWGYIEREGRKAQALQIAQQVADADPATQTAMIKALKEGDRVNAEDETPIDLGAVKAALGQLHKDQMSPALLAVRNSIVSGLKSTEPKPVSLSHQNGILIATLVAVTAVENRDALFQSMARTFRLSEKTLKQRRDKAESKPFAVAERPAHITPRPYTVAADGSAVPEPVAETPKRRGGRKAAHPEQRTGTHG